jgi:hypothetical protein
MLHFLEIVRRTHLFDGLDLVGVRLNSMVSDKEIQKFSRWHAEGASGVELDV